MDGDNDRLTREEDYNKGWLLARTKVVIEEMEEKL